MRTLFTLTSAIAIAAAIPATAVQAGNGDHAQDRSERAQTRAEARADRRQETRRARVQARVQAQAPRARDVHNAAPRAHAEVNVTAQRRNESRQQERRAEDRQQQNRAEARQQQRRAEARQEQRRAQAQQQRRAQAQQQRRAEVRREQHRAEARQEQRRDALRVQNRAEVRAEQRRNARRANARVERRADTRQRRLAIARDEARRNAQLDHRRDRIRAERRAEYRQRQAAARRLAQRRAEYRERMQREERRLVRADRRARDRYYAASFYRNSGWNQAAYRDRMNRIWRQQARQEARRRHVRAVRLYSRGDRWAQADSGYYYSPSVVRRIVSYRQPAYYYPGNSYDYRYASGYAYRIDPETQLIAALLPLLGGAFDIGQTIPAGYNVYNLPTQYRTIYPDNGAYAYRYGDNAIYRVDRSNGEILGVPTLLTSGFQVGRPIPAGYGAYNVPYDYRDRYYDTDDYMYRYNNGRIYQVDATTRLVTAAIELFV